MRKLALAAVALTLASCQMPLRTAQAQEEPRRELPLADPLIGHWCRIKQKVYRGDLYQYQRGPWDCAENLAVRSEGIDDFASDNGPDRCKFTRVRPERGGYAINGNCDKTGTFQAFLKIVANGQLYYYYNDRRCAVVKGNMPDGFLNLRAGPGTRYPVRAKLITGDGIEVRKETRNGYWARVTVPYLHDIDGWVSTEFIKYLSYDRDANCESEGDM